ncbi:YqeB family protein [Flindersiella endophytica]
MNAHSATVVAQPKGEAALVWAGFPIVGAGLAWLLQSLAGRLVSLPWVPFEGPLRLIDEIPEPQATIGALIVGALAGLAFAAWGAREYVTVTVDNDQITTKQGDSTRVVGRGSVTAAFVDGKQLVLLDRSSKELLRQRGDLPNAKRLRAAFGAHGYPWRDADPFQDAYKRWVVDSPDLPAEAHALLKARARAVENDDRDDADELRDELSKLGVVVRDRDKRQSYRRTTE